jgi:hypothetical protein
MRLQEITKTRLLRNKNIRSVDFEHEWYFVARDLNEEFLGAFNNVPYLALPILVNGERVFMNCIRYKDIQEKVDSLSGKSDFEININTILNFNPKRNR